MTKVFKICLCLMVSEFCIKILELILEFQTIRILAILTKHSLYLLIMQSRH